MKRSIDEPWWVNAHERPAWLGEFEKALVEADLCDWTGGRLPHPQEPALFAWWWFRNHPEALLNDGGGA